MRQPREVLRRPQLPHQPGGVPGRAAGKSATLQEEHVANPALGEVVGHAAAHDAAAVAAGNEPLYAAAPGAAPLLGLLGTVIGMIAGFGTLEIAGVGKEELAKAIRMALITTASGLAIAIPTIIASTYFRSRIRRITAEFEEIFIDLIKTVKAANDDAGGSESASEEQPAKK